MAFTGVLGTSDSRPGSFALGRIGEPPAATFDPEVIQSLNLDQTLVLEKDSNLSITQTLTLTQVGEKTPAFPAIVGRVGGQTRYAFSIDIDANQELHKLDEDVVFNYPASITKLMTLLLLFEYHESNLAATVTVTSADLSIFGGASVASLLNGDVLTWEELAYAIVIPSGGDACQTAARIIGTEIYVAAGSIGTTGMTRFIARMNARAAELGMTNTFYYDSWGESTITGSVRNSTTARDVATLLAECIEHSDLNTVIGTATYMKVFGSPNARTLNWSNVNRLVNGPTTVQAGIKDDNVIGGKVGEWNGDGVHVSLANAWIAPNGNRIVTVVFNSTTYILLTWDQQGLMYMAITDWPYLTAGLPEVLDLDFAKVKVLATGNGSIVDESSFGRTATLTGATVGPPFLSGSAGSMVLTHDGAVEFADAADLDISSDDATIEVWYKAAASMAFGEELLFFVKNAASNGEWAMDWFPSALQIFANATGSAFTSTVLTFTDTESHGTFFNGAPRHLAWVKEGSTIAGYINGERWANEISMATIFDGNAPVTVGGTPNSDTTANGTYGDFRFTTELARYTLEKHTVEPRSFGRAAVAATPASNALGLSQTLGLAKDIVRSVPHTLSLTQLARKVIDESITSTLVPDQDVTFEKFKQASASNTLVSTHSVVVEVTIKRSINQGLPISQVAGRSIYRALSPTNTLTPTQLASAVVTHPANNTLSLSQSAVALVAKSVHQALVLTQIVDVDVTYRRNTADNYIPFQTLTRNITAHLAAANTLTMSQALVVHNVHSAHNVLALTQSVVVDRVKPAINLLNIAQLVQVSRTIGKNIESEMDLVHTLIVSKGKALSLTHALGFNQFARGTRRLTVAAANTLALAQALVREYKNRSISQTLTLTQSGECSKLAPRTIEQSLLLTDTVSVAKTLVRSIVDTLVFKTTFEKYVGIADHEFVSVPAVQVVKVKKVVVLQSNTLVIVLPAPEFGDAESGTGRINIKRTMAGGRRVYARDNVTSKLNYQFIIDRKKAIELRNFILNSNTKFLHMENWKGELWAVQMTNSPFSFGEDAAWLGSSGGNKSSITLEFEGVRLN